MIAGTALAGAAVLLPGCGGSGGLRAFVADFFAEDRIVHPDSGASAIHDQPALCCEREDVCVAWREIRTPGDQRIWFTRSTNGGASFGRTPRRLDTGLTGAGLRGSVTMCRDGDRIYVAWLDTRDGRADVRFNRSVDGGDTWLLADIKVNTNLAGTLTHRDLTMCCEGDRVHIAFVVAESGQLLVALSTTAGSGFVGQPVCVHAPSAAPSEPFLCCDAGEVYVAWSDVRDGEADVYVNRSDDGGTSWEPDGVRIDRGPAGAAASRRPRLCCEDRRVYAIWEDTRVGRTVYFNRSVDGGRTWRSIDTRLDGLLMAPTAIGGFDLCCSGSDVHVVWTDNRNGGADAFVRRSLDSGLTFGPETRIDPGAPGVSASVRPRLCCAGRHVFAAWVEGSPENVWFSWSTERGAAWASTPLRMNTTSDGVFPGALPALCCSARNVYVAWSDRRGPPGQQIRLNASGP